MYGPGPVQWEPFTGVSVVGDVRVRRAVEGRDVYVYLPPSHGSGRRFPVVYMHDGQNLFDNPTSHSGVEWRVDETMEELAGEGLEALVVGISVDETRQSQYAGAGAEAYLRFVVETVRPLVAEAFDIDERRQATGVAGSSLGGVISLHALYAHPDVFGFAGVFSPAFWFNDDALFDVVEREPPPDARIYIDVGDREWNDGDDTRGTYVDGFRRMTALLRTRGFDERMLRAVLEEGGAHHERDWARRLPDALRFLLGSVKR